MQQLQNVGYIVICMYHRNKWSVIFLNTLHSQDQCLEERGCLAYEVVERPIVVAGVAFVQ